MGDGEKRRTFATIFATVVATATIYYACESFYEKIMKKRRENAPESGGIGYSLPSTQLDKYGGCIYLDYNATTPVFPEVTEAMEPFTWSCFGNPSSPHVYAEPCRDAVHKARQATAVLIGAENEKCIIFTSCGSESDNRAIDIALHQFREAYRGASDPEKIPHVITSAVEHPAVLVYLRHLEQQQQITLTVVGVNGEGMIDPKDVESALIEHEQNTALVTIMHSNNEVGTVQPIRAIGSVLMKMNNWHKNRHLGIRTTSRKHRILFHSDAAQSLGKVGIDVLAFGVDMLTIVGHKFGAPKGVAALYIREELLQCTGQAALQPFLYGGGQEGGMRSGTENVLLIAALGAASRIAFTEAVPTLLHLLDLKCRLIVALKEGLRHKGPEFLRFNGPDRSNDPSEIASDIGMLKLILSPISHEISNPANPEEEFFAGESNRNNSSTRNGMSDSGRPDARSFARTSSNLVEQLPNTVSVSMKGVKMTQLMPLLISKVACSAGSACHTADASGGKLSPVLEAMQVDQEYGQGTLRLSFGRHTTRVEIQNAAQIIAFAVNTLSL